MCGIVAYIGPKQAYPILLKGLKRLEYRGYDSAGIALIDNGQLKVYKRKGRVAELEEQLTGMPLSSTIGIGHTRWATHGEPSDRNAHPHLSQSGKLAMIHNGIIENYAQLKQELLTQGYHFRSDTDTEVLLNFIENIRHHNQCSLEEAVRIALRRVVGAYVIVLLDADNPHTLIAARKGSPLVIGIGKGEHLLASDASPILEHTKEVVYVNDYQIAIVGADELVLKNLGNERQTPFITRLDMDLAAIEKGGFEHFMLKEIFEQPTTVLDCMRGRLDAYQGRITLSGVEQHLEILTKAQRIIIIACGTSWHAGLVGEYLLETLCRLPVEVEYASEFRYRHPVINPRDVILAISQSGETADTLVAIEKAKESGAFIYGIVNVVGSSIARLSHTGTYTHAGPEIGVASTKAFTAQLTVIALFALRLALARGTISKERFLSLCNDLAALPDKIRHVLDHGPAIAKLAQHYQHATNFLYLGRGYNFPIALEGALKLKEISYIHAEGYPAGEMKHGPIALVDEHLPVVFIATKDALHEKIISNIQEVRARKGRVIAVLTEGDHFTAQFCEACMFVPEIEPLLSPIINVVPLQLLAYYIGVAKGLDVDKPRNLAKSVTVE
ncbi:MAG: glutamine--fructose-6-phosphate transaminase (isomerizing) [Cytophagales bacterium]|nr:glutamine--fructose-6-phosphate transaminase (isomerizing) [Bernardetiaceae bacterium]MDW8211190.1 glutamine--fructose-6-phosphate transaminase (isomerizing) [Cytophagales bacterium]